MQAATSPHSPATFQAFQAFQAFQELEAFQVRPPEIQLRNLQLKQAKVQAYQA